MSLRAHIRSIELSSGEEFYFSSEEAILFVGPNNSGKSQILQDILIKMGDVDSSAISISSIDISLDMNDDELMREIEPYKTKYGEYHFTSGNSIRVDYFWNWGKVGRISRLRDILLSVLLARSRLSDCDEVDSVNPSHIPELTHPFHWMSRTATVEHKVSEQFRRAFGTDLVIWPGGGGKTFAFLGERPALSANESRNSESYARAVEKLDRLADQGDGIRSYASIVGRLVTEERPIMVIDEPEAFLHPPQARKIGVAMGEHRTGRQTFIATHSQDVLLGLISSAETRVSVIRLSNIGGTRSAKRITSADIAQLWGDPLLRYSQVLDGLFHDAVIVSESDYDCRFFQAVMDTAVPEPERPDFHYVHAGGKSRMHIMIKALSSVGVPVAAVYDFDVLNDETVISRAVEATGNDWSVYRPDWSLINQKVTAKVSHKKRLAVAGELKKVINNYAGSDLFTKADSKIIESLIDVKGPWEQVKQDGVNGLSKYGCFNEGERLLAALQAIGIFIVPVGEMEGFDRAITAKKGNWVAEALDKDLNRPQLREARDFVARISEWALTP